MIRIIDDLRKEKFMNKTTLEKVKNNDEVINDLFNKIENIILKNKTKKYWFFVK